eukprot:10959609-Prorocentrum_lima.AAC.1
MTSSLVGSEMCIRDRQLAEQTALREQERRIIEAETREVQEQRAGVMRDCLLYTSDAADDM